MKENRHLSKPIIGLFAVLLFLATWLSFPQMAYSKTIFLGDSRTVGMYNTVAGHTMSGEIQDTSTTDTWCAKGSMGYTWFDSVAVPFADAVVESGDSIVILMGCNDLASNKEWMYAALVNEKAIEWKTYGANTFFASVNPISDDLTASYGYMVRNHMVDDFNSALEPLLSEDVVWIDTNSVLTAEGYDTFDGVHYNTSTCRRIYDLCQDAVAGRELPQATAVKENVVLDVVTETDGIDGTKSIGASNADDENNEYNEDGHAEEENIEGDNVELEVPDYGDHNNAYVPAALQLEAESMSSKMESAMMPSSSFKSSNGWQNIKVENEQTNSNGHFLGVVLLLFIAISGCSVWWYKEIKVNEQVVHRRRS